MVENLTKFLKMCGNSLSLLLTNSESWGGGLIKLNNISALSSYDPEHQRIAKILRFSLLTVSFSQPGIDLINL